jgi:hypothetical protein
LTDWIMHKFNMSELNFHFYEDDPAGMTALSQLSNSSNWNQFANYANTTAYQSGYNNYHFNTQPQYQMVQPIYTTNYDSYGTYQTPYNHYPNYYQNNLGDLNRQLGKSHNNSYIRIHIYPSGLAVTVQPGEMNIIYKWVARLGGGIVDGPLKQFSMNPHNKEVMAGVMTIRDDGMRVVEYH